MIVNIKKYFLSVGTGNRKNSLRDKYEMWLNKKCAIPQVLRIGAPPWKDRKERISY